VSPGDLDGWAGYAGAGFHRRQFSGGHYFHEDQRVPVLGALARLAEGQRLE